jgi:hypothetical protein
MKGYKYLVWRKLIEDGEKGEYHHKKSKSKKGIKIGKEGTAKQRMKGTA